MSQSSVTEHNVSIDEKMDGSRRSVIKMLHAWEYLKPLGNEQISVTEEPTEIGCQNYSERELNTEEEKDEDDTDDVHDEDNLDKSIDEVQGILKDLEEIEQEIYSRIESINKK